MPTDVFYGADAAARIGLMADKDTDPTAWHAFEFMSWTASPITERRQRAKLGGARHNALDPLKPRKGFKRVSADLVVDADSLQTPRLIRDLLGAPTTTGPSSGIYTHVWESGSKTIQYACIQIRPTPTSKVYIYRGITLGALALAYTGEQTQDFDLQFALRGLTRTRGADWLSGSVTAAPAEAPISRAVFRMDGVAASDTLNGAWSWDRQIVEDIFASTTPTPSGLRTSGSAVSGSANFRALAESIEDLEEADTVFAPDHQMLGVTSGHEITLAHLQALLDPGQLSIAGEGLQERSWTWNAHQSDSAPAVRITAKNSVASYAS